MRKTKFQNSGNLNITVPLPFLEVTNNLIKNMTPFRPVELFLHLDQMSCFSFSLRVVLNWHVSNNQEHYANLKLF